jgi:cholera toxin transcriptional activator
MPFAPTPLRVARFGIFEADFAAGEVRKAGIKIKLHDQPLQILAMLLEHPGELVTREDIRGRLWPGNTFVDFDHGLNNAVNRCERRWVIPPTPRVLSKPFPVADTDS